MKNLFKKVMIGQTMFGPVMIAIFFTYNECKLFCLLLRFIIRDKNPIVGIQYKIILSTNIIRIESNVIGLLNL